MFCSTVIYIKYRRTAVLCNMEIENKRSKCRPTTVIDAVLWDEFVQAAARRFGYRKGVIQKALECAIRDWLGETDNET